MIKFSEEEGFIKAHGFKHIEGQDKNIKLPKVAVGVFSRHLFDDVIEKYSALEVGYFSCANMERNIYIIKYKDIEIVFFMAGVSGPWIAGDIEELYSAGVQKVIIFGNCGVLDSKIEDCSIIIPTKGFRDEGTSYHYVSPSETIEINPDYKEDFIKILNEYNFDYTEGYTWTIDAFYRETKDKIKYSIVLGAERFVKTKYDKLFFRYGGEFGFSYGKQEAKADDESYLGKSIGEAFGYRVAGVTGFDYFVSKALFISIEIRPIAYDYTVYNIRPQVGLKLLSSDTHGFDFLSNPMLKIGFRF